MKKLLILPAFFLITFVAQTQKNIFMDVAPMFQNANLEMNINYTAWNGKTFKLDHFDYYLSNIELTYDGGQTILIDSVFLIEYYEDWCVVVRKLQHELRVGPSEVVLGILELNYNAYYRLIL